MRSSLNRIVLFQFLFSSRLFIVSLGLICRFVHLKYQLEAPLSSCGNDPRVGWLAFALALFPNVPSDYCHALPCRRSISDYVDSIPQLRLRLRIINCYLGHLASA